MLSISEDKINEADRYADERIDNNKDAVENFVKKASNLIEENSSLSEKTRVMKSLIKSLIA